MGCTVKHMLLLFVIIQHIGGMYSINCPTYEKHELLRKGLLNHKSICRAIQYGLEEKICLNGLKPVGSDCNTGHCLFNIWCTGVCFTGNDNNLEHLYYLYFFIFMFIFFIIFIF